MRPQPFTVPIETGDCLIHRRGRLSVIGLWMPWVHVDIGLVYPSGSVWAIGATMPTVTAIPLETLVAKGRRILVRRVPEEVRAPGDEEGARRWLEAQVGTRAYDGWSLLQLAWRCPLRWRPPSKKSDGTLHLRGVICSALYSQFCRENYRDVEAGTGWDPVPEHCDRWTTPLDLAETSRLETICNQLRLRHTT